MLYELISSCDWSKGEMAQLAATNRDLRYTVLCGRSTITNIILACSLDIFQYRGMHALPLGKSFLILIAFRAGQKVFGIEKSMHKWVLMSI